MAKIYRTVPAAPAQDRRSGGKGPAVRKQAARRPVGSRAAGSRSKRAAAGRPLRSRTRQAAASGRAVLAFPARRGALSVIISARNEERTLPKLLEQVTLLQPLEIIVVLNGCDDRSFQRTRLCRQATVIHIPESAGHDVGRSIGAKLSRGDILLFLDGDMSIPARQLAGFVTAVDGGVDVALNNLDPLLPSFGLSDAVTRCKLYLNSALGRSDLGASSMTAVPHALSRRALQVIGYRELMVPPKAQAISILRQLRVEKAGAVDVIKHNRLRQGNTGTGNAMEQLIAGDHAEALVQVLEQHRTGVQLSEAHLLEQRRQLAAWRNAL
ncbi:glycosyltransferase [Paenibacillus sp. MMS20-IR301]|uniref:glycosyltransferase family 2 protein n=1 Tax=Paenibacillus sp. MMS20-IR301 TaxID=2895946 RepID=UPI0028EC8011|nr:glycosyltransferase [Paenibacillus sp. MMS20-IR301]WNS47097.1 glycosyltransferase [Paenibacillus sp. MMS20-IR301]